MPVTYYEDYDDKYCEAIICTSKKTILASVYRPPKAPKESFCKLVDFLQKYIEKECTGNPELYKIVITGDFNFPGVSWDDLSVGSCTSEAKSSAEYILSFMSKNLLSQFVTLLQEWIKIYLIYL